MKRILTSLAALTLATACGHSGSGGGGDDGANGIGGAKQKGQISVEQGCEDNWTVWSVQIYGYTEIIYRTTKTENGKKPVVDVEGYRIADRTPESFKKTEVENGKESELDSIKSKMVSECVYLEKIQREKGSTLFTFSPNPYPKTNKQETIQVEAGTFEVGSTGTDFSPDSYSSYSTKYVRNMNVYGYQYKVPLLIKESSRSPDGTITLKELISFKP